MYVASGSETLVIVGLTSEAWVWHLRWGLGVVLADRTLYLWNLVLSGSVISGLNSWDTKEVVRELPGVVSVRSVWGG